MKKATTVSKVIILLTVLLSFGACRKDAISVKNEKHYTERVTNGMSLLLKPNGSAELIEGGDMVSKGNYKIKGNKLTLRSSNQSSDFNFTIISEQEIQSETGNRLILLQP